MTEPTTAEALLDAARPNAFVFRVWALCILVALLDGFDLTLVSFIAPYLSAQHGWGDAQLGMVFAASLVGMAVGGPISGWLGDLWGRKPMLIVSCFLLGVPTLAILAATTPAAVAACRFVTGLGLSAAIPNVLALCAEISPARFRGRALASMSLAIPVGATVPGLLAATLVPRLGWEVLVLIGGLLPLVIASLLLPALPESPKFLMLRPQSRNRARAVLARIDPGFLKTDMSAMAVRQPGTASISPAPLFRRSGRLHLVTPLLWAQFFIVVLVNFQINNWLPSILAKGGLSPAQAGFGSALWSLGGVLGGLLVMGVLPRLGARLLVTVFAVAIPATLLMAQAKAYFWICFWVAIGGISVGCLQIALNTICSMVYDTSVRVKGVGWALSVGRLGGICGPLLGGFALSRGISPSDIIAMTAIPLAAGLAVSILFAAVGARGRRSASDNTSAPGIAAKGGQPSF